MFVVVIAVITYYYRDYSSGEGTRLGLGLWRITEKGVEAGLFIPYEGSYWSFGAYWLCIGCYILIFTS